jgi:DNA glycosylase AlkZ-like
MTPLDVAQRRLRNERLVGPAFAAPADVVSWLGAVQSQDYGGAKWAVAQRARGCSDADVEEACDRGDIVRTHVMRPTWHFVTSADARWMLELTAPRVHAANAYYYRQLELDERVFTKSHAALAAALRGGRHLTRVELGHALERAGIRAAGTRLAYVLMRAELDAVICSGPRRGKQFTYALFDERVPASKPLARDQALAELVRRYFASHGPATVQDFAWWSGLTVADGTKGIDLAKASLVRDVVDGKSYWQAPTRPPPAPKKPTIHLLPNFDEYLVAYKDHGSLFDRDVRAMFDRRDNFLSNHIVVRNGRVIGGWRRTLGRGMVSIETRLLVPLDAAETSELARAAERYGRFLGLGVKLTTRPVRARGRLRSNRARQA